MTRTADLQDRLAARLLGVTLDADAAQIRGQFRRLAKAVHPDASVVQGCVDLGRLAEAKDRLVARADQIAAERAVSVAAAWLVAAQANRERARIETERSRREAAARRTVDAMRSGVDGDEPADFVAFAAATDRATSRRRGFGTADRLGQRIDLAG